MHRRKVLGALAAGALAAPAMLHAQRAATVRRVGFFYFGSRQSAHDTGRYAQFVLGLRELGYEDGRNLLIEARFADGRTETLPGLVAEFVRMKVDVIVATGGPVYHALQQASVPIPVVVTVASDPVGSGFVQSLARPGGNFTGLSENNAELVTKHLDLLRSVNPRLARVAVLANPANGPSSAVQVKSVEAMAGPLGIAVFRVDSDTAAGNERAFATMARERVQAVILLADTFFVQQSRELAELAIAHRLPSIFGTQDYARAGGLLSYGSEIGENFRRVAAFVDRILKGAKPGDLPMEQPTRYLLTINLRTARAIGVAIGRDLRLRADRVIE